MTDYENIRLIRQPARRVQRQHLWRRPWESVVAGLLGERQLQAMYETSMGLTVPVPILCMPQVQVYRGQLLPTIQGGGFSSLGDLIAKATAGAQQTLPFSKVGVTGVATFCNTLWYEGTLPGVGATAAARAAGTDCTRTTAGALGQFNAVTGTQHLTGGMMSPSVAAMTLLVYDRIWHGEPAVSTSGNQTVTMTPARYAGTGANATSAGNFAMVEARAALGATAHTWTMTYVDDQNNTAEASAAMTGNASNIAKRIDTANTYFAIPLNAGDVGISDITIIANSASVSGAQCLVLGHPLAFMPGPYANVMFPLDMVSSQFNLARVYDNACIAFLENQKNAVTATTYTGQLTTVYG